MSSNLSRSSRRRSMTLDSRAESVLSVLPSSPSSSCVPREMRAPYSPSEMRRATCVSRRMGLVSTCVIFMAMTTASSTVTAAVMTSSICKTAVSLCSCATGWARMTPPTTLPAVLRTGAPAKRMTPEAKSKRRMSATVSPSNMRATNWRSMELMISRRATPAAGAGSSVRADVRGQVIAVDVEHHGAGQALVLFDGLFIGDGQLRAVGDVAGGDVLRLPHQLLHGLVLHIAEGERIGHHAGKDDGKKRQQRMADQRLCPDRPRAVAKPLPHAMTFP